MSLMRFDPCIATVKQSFTVSHFAKRDPTPALQRNQLLSLKETISIVHGCLSVFPYSGFDLGILLTSAFLMTLEFLEF